MRRVESVILSAEEIAAIITGKIPPVSNLFDGLLGTYPDLKPSFSCVGNGSYEIKLDAEFVLLKLNGDPA